MRKNTLDQRRTSTSPKSESSALTQDNNVVSILTVIVPWISNDHKLTLSRHTASVAVREVGNGRARSSTHW